MRVVIAILLLFSFCTLVKSQESKDASIREFTKDIVSFAEGELSIYSPISSFNKVAINQASKSVVLTKENIAESLAEAKNFSYCFITVGTHTIAKVTNLEKTAMSGSWGCKIPYGEGYVQKGTLNFKQDFINNIIGLPDSQRRMVFYFK